jgi:hypothetical protein
MSTLLRGAYFGVAMMAFLHLYMKYVLLLYPSSLPLCSVPLRLFLPSGPEKLTHHPRYTQPLFMQALMGVKGLYDAKEVHIHLLGTPAEGDYKRPFKAAPSMFGGGEFLQHIPFSAAPNIYHSGGWPGDGCGEHCGG